MSGFMNNKQQAIFAQIADELIPAAEDMPSASEVHVPTVWAEEVLNLRPDLRDDFFRGLRVFDGARDLKDGVVRLQAQDPEAFNAIGVVAAGAYFLNPDIRERIGYPGQESRGSYVAGATPEYVQNGALESVLKRGSIFRKV